MDAFKVRFLCARGRRSLMADIVSPEKRSQNMSAIRSKNTKPEVYLRKLLFAQGYRYRIADKSVPGHPDIFCVNTIRRFSSTVASGIVTQTANTHIRQRAAWSFGKRSLMITSSGMLW